MRIMSIMAHQDDFEFTAGGLFAALRAYFNDKLAIKIVATTRGASGHHAMTPEETFARRDGEARRSAAIIDAEYECVKQLDGTHLPGQVFIDRNFLGGLWNCIRDFEPDLIFCPPVITDPLAGVHIDHINTAIAVRYVAYQLLVPHAYPTMEGQTKRRVPYPVIINVDDSYACETDYHFTCDVSAVYETKVAMALCHVSQIFEWLPFTMGKEEPISEEAFRESFLRRHSNLNNRYKQPTQPPREYFQVTKWGRTPTTAELEAMLPMVVFNDTFRKERVSDNTERDEHATHKKTT